MAHRSSHIGAHDRDIGLGTMLSASTIIIIGIGFSTVWLDRHFRGNQISLATHTQSIPNISNSRENARGGDEEFETSGVEPNLPNWVRVAQSSNFEEEVPQSPAGPAPPQSVDESVRSYQSSPWQPNADQKQEFDSAPFEEALVSATWPEPVEDSPSITTTPDFAEAPTSAIEFAMPAPPLSFPAEETSDTSPSPRGISIADVQPHITEGPAWKIQLISLTKRADAERVWSGLQKRHEDLLGGLALRVEVANLSKGIFYRLQAGPLASGRAAAELCNSLKARNQDCLAVNP